MKDISAGGLFGDWRSNYGAMNNRTAFDTKPALGRACYLVTVYITASGFVESIMNEIRKSVYVVLEQTLRLFIIVP
jgi:hypothetical protein